MRLRARRRRQDPRTEKLLQSIATVLINSRGGSSTCAQDVSFTCNETGEKERAKQFDAKSAKLSVSSPAEPLTVCARPRRKNFERLPHRVEHPRHCTVCPVPCN